jgi:predicted Zn-dependent protease
MALAAYEQLETKDADARYHAGLVMLETGQVDEASALADTILAQSPGHLFGLQLRANVAERRGDSARARQARAEFVKRYDAEVASGKAEYGEHRTALEAFRKSSER